LIYTQEKSIKDVFLSVMDTARVTYKEGQSNSFCYNKCIICDISFLE